MNRPTGTSENLEHVNSNLALLLIQKKVSRPSSCMLSSIPTVMAAVPPSPRGLKCRGGCPFRHFRPGIRRDFSFLASILPRLRRTNPAMVLNRTFSPLQVRTFIFLQNKKDRGFMHCGLNLNDMSKDKRMKERESENVKQRRHKSRNK